MTQTPSSSGVSGVEKATEMFWTAPGQVEKEQLGIIVRKEFVVGLIEQLRLARREAFEEAATIAGEYAAQMWAVAESRRDQGMFEAAYQHEAAREACNVVAELILARSLLTGE